MQPVIPKKSIILFCCMLSLQVFSQDSTRYRYFLGANFDFIDGVEAKKLYHHVDVNLPDISGTRKGFIAGIYQMRQVSKIDTTNYLSRGNNLRQYTAFPASDTGHLRIILADSANLQKTTTTKAFGVYFQPTYRIGDSSETNLYGVGHFEYTHRNIEQKYIVSSKARDTVTITKTDLLKYPALPPDRIIKSSQDEGYFGVGLVLNHKNRFVELQVKGIVGKASLDKWYWFYSVDASLIVLKGNFELGVSYKGLLPNYPPYFLNVHLSKAFFLDEIGKLLN